jgi:hypothetical protein
MKTPFLILALLFTLFVTSCVVESTTDADKKTDTSEDTSSATKNNAENSDNSVETNDANTEGDAANAGNETQNEQQTDSTNVSTPDAPADDGERGGSPTGSGSTGGTNSEIKPDPVSQTIFYQVSGDIQGQPLPIQLRYKDKIQSAENVFSYSFSVESGELFSLLVINDHTEQVCVVKKNNFVVNSDVTDAHIECTVKDEYLLSLKGNVSGLESKIAIRIGDKWIEVTEDGEFDYQVINGIEYEVTINESSESQTCTGNLTRFTAAQSSQLQITCQDVNATNP